MKLVSNLLQLLKASVQFDISSVQLLLLLFEVIWYYYLNSIKKKTVILIKWECQHEVNHMICYVELTFNQTVRELIKQHV